MGVLPRDLDLWLKYTREGTGWKKRSLSDLESLLGALRITLVRGAWHVYRTRCSLMGAWWASPAATTHRANRAWDLAEKTRKRREAASARIMATFLSQHPEPRPARRRYPLRERRPPDFLGERVLGTTETVAELAAERRDMSRKWASSALPWF